LAFQEGKGNIKLAIRWKLVKKLTDRSRQDALIQGVNGTVSDKQYKQKG